MDLSHSFKLRPQPDPRHHHRVLLYGLGAVFIIIIASCIGYLYGIQLNLGSVGQYFFPQAKDLQYDIASWKTYSNVKYSISFKYPSQLHQSLAPGSKEDDGEILAPVFVSADNKTQLLVHTALTKKDLNYRPRVLGSKTIATTTTVVLGDTVQIQVLETDPNTLSNRDDPSVMLRNTYIASFKNKPLEVELSGPKVAISLGGFKQILSTITFTGGNQIVVGVTPTPSFSPSPSVSPSLPPIPVTVKISPDGSYVATEQQFGDRQSITIYTRDGHIIAYDVVSANSQTIGYGVTFTCPCSTHVSDWIDNTHFSILISNEKLQQYQYGVDAKTGLVDPSTFKKIK